MDQATATSKQSATANVQSGIAVLEVGTAPVNWNNDDLPQWRRHLPLTELLDAMASAGYSGTEYGAGFPRDPAELRAELEPRGLKLTGSYQWLHFQHATVFALELTELDRVLRALAELDCTNLIVASAMTPERIAIAGRVPDDGSYSLPRHGWSTLAEGLARVRDHAAIWGIRVHFHNHVGSHVETPVELVRFLEVMPDGVDLCFDTGHYAFGGGDPLWFAQHHAHRIGYVHLKDVDQNVVTQARAEQLGFLNALRRFVFTELGNGAVDIPAVIAALRDARYAGWIIVEQDTCRGDQTETAAQNRAYLRSSCGI